MQQLRKGTLQFPEKCNMHASLYQQFFWSSVLFTLKNMQNSLCIGFYCNIISNSKRLMLSNISDFLQGDINQPQIKRVETSLP